MKTLLIIIVLDSLGIVFFLIPDLLGRKKTPLPSFSDTDDSCLIGECFDNRTKSEKLIEHEKKHDSRANAGLIKKLIWISVIAVAVFAVFYISLLRR